ERLQKPFPSSIDDGWPIFKNPIKKSLFKNPKPNLPHAHQLAKHRRRPFLSQNPQSLHLYLHLLVFLSSAAAYYNPHKYSTVDHHRRDGLQMASPDATSLVRWHLQTRCASDGNVDGLWMVSHGLPMTTHKISTATTFRQILNVEW
uniref:Uncharacterized protein n=1 Tax=Cucumis melo TaxID=3656 RepID=A0A9I9EJN2_CUCME